MIVLILLAFVGMLTGIFLILGMTPFTFAEELTKPLSGRCDLYCDSELLYAAGFGGRDGLAPVLVCPVHLSQL